MWLYGYVAMWLCGYHQFIISKDSSFLISKNPGFLNFKNSKSGQLRFPKFRKFWSSEFFEKYFPIFSRGLPWFFLDLIQVIPPNKMKKYGLPEPKTLRNHEMLSFRCLMPWNRDFISLPWRRKIQIFFVDLSTGIGRLVNISWIINVLVLEARISSFY